MKQKLCKLLFGLGLVLCLQLSAAAAEPEITPQMTLREIRANTAIQGSGIMTYARDKSAAQQLYWQDKRLDQYMNASSVRAAVDALNLVIENYNAGVQVTHGIYTQEEVAAEPEKGGVELYYFPAQNAQGSTRYALVIPGNALSRTAEISEGFPAAYELNRMGYTVFVLRYRTWQQMDNNAPIEDLGRAVQYITAHAQELGVRPEGYALVGFSSGGQIAGMFGGRRYGWSNFGVPKPGALLLGYPVNNFTVVSPAYHLTIDCGAPESRYYDYSISGQVDADYPPVWFWYGKNDLTLQLLGYCKQGPALQKALEASGVPYRCTVYDNAPHGISVGDGTDAEGWLIPAAAFWDEQTAHGPRP